MTSPRVEAAFDAALNNPIDDEQRQSLIFDVLYPTIHFPEIRLPEIHNFILPLNSSESWKEH